MDVLIVDGYNMIGSWPELKQLKTEELAAARDRLVEILADYQAFTGIRVIVVFDAYDVKGPERKKRAFNVEIIFTKERETADERIEKLAKELRGRNTRVFVATSDYAEQWTIFSQGAYRKSAREFYEEIQDIEKKIAQRVNTYHRIPPAAKIPLPREIADVFEKFRRGK
jgi:Protein of unknown function (DUF901).